MADHARSAFRGLNSVLKLLVRRINSSGDIAIYRFWRFGLKLPIDAPFGEFLGHISPYDVTHRADLQNDRPWAGTCHLSLSAWESVHRFDLGADSRKKGQDNKKVTKVLYFPYLRVSPTGPIRPKCRLVGDVHDVITCTKFKIEIFMSYNFRAGRIFDFPIHFCMGLTTVQR